MGFDFSLLWTAPELNPVNKKARSIPAFNPVNIYGRVFSFSWFGFLIAFLSWYAFPPLLTKTIKKDLHLTTAEIQNSNISALTATLLVRFVSGPLCDRYGPRYVFVGCLLAGAVPTALAGTVTSAAGLITLRFFIGILGASFVPCQVWSTGFFDKNVVGSANALVGGFGNAGGGITYFVMPAIFDSLVHERGLTEHVAWRVAFIVPFIIITVTAIFMLLLCPDTPVGKWADRHQHVVENIEQQVAVTEDHTTGIIGSTQIASISSGSDNEKDKKLTIDPEAAIGESQAVQGYTAEIIRKPTAAETLRVITSPQTIVLAFSYFCSFGAELAINSILGTYYNKNLKLDQTHSGRWAAMFGLLNVAFRPAGGFIADIIYRYTHSEHEPKSTRGVWAKKIWIHFLGFVTGAFCIAIGLTDPKRLSLMVGLVAGLAFFMDAGNGANFALVPHVHPHANGVVSGFTGATGNLGGIIFSIIFRFNHTDYGKVMWIIGVMTIAIHICLSWIKPLPNGQIGGH